MNRTRDRVVSNLYHDMQRSATMNPTSKPFPGCARSLACNPRSHWRRCLSPTTPLLAGLLVALAAPVGAETYHVGVRSTFSPATLSIRVGDTVVWENEEEGLRHTTTSDLPGSHTNYWCGAMGEHGATFSRTFTCAGTFSYHDQLDFGAGLIQVSASASTAALSSPRKQDGRFVFEATGLALGQTNVLQASGDLTNWTALSTNVAPDAAMTFSNSATLSRSFFRLADAGPPAPVDVPYQWECQIPFPQGQHLNDVSALDASSVWAVGSSVHGGADGVIVHWDGTAWSVQVSGLANGLFGVCAVASNRVWAVGARGAILHYDGARWRPQVSGTEQWLYGVSTQQDASNVWAVGHSGTILRYDGTAWTAQNSGTAYQLRGVSVADATNIWAVGDQGTILHYDGSRWSAQASGITEHLRGVCARTASDVWAVGYNSAILHYDGVRWSRQEAPRAGLDLKSVSASAGDSVWAVSISSVTALHYDGTKWSSVTSIPGYPFGVCALDHNHVWMVGMNGSIAFWDGAQGQRQDQRARTLRALSASAPDNAWAVGFGGAILHYNGTGWSSQANGTGTATLLGVAALDATEAWAVGYSGTILHYDGMLWSKQISEFATSHTLKGVAALASDQVWAVGDEGTILHYDGLSWGPQNSGTTRFLHAVSGCDRRNVWAVGEGGTILHYDGTNWSAQASGTAYALYGVSALAADQAWAVGAFGTLLHWDGTRWTAQPSGISKTFWGVSALDAANVWAVGGEGILLHWNGAGWHINRRGYAKQDWFWGVCATDTNHVWVVGEDFSSVGFILHGKPGGPPAVSQEPITVTFDPWVPFEGMLPAKVDLRGEMPPVQNQSDIDPGGQTCGPWAVAYYQLTQWVKHFKRPNWDLTRPEYQMSPAFAYKSSGTEPFTGLTNRGCVDLAEVPYDTSFVGPDPNPAQLEAAKPFRIKGPRTLWDDNPAPAPYTNDPVKIATAKTNLAQGYMLSVEVNVGAGDFPDSDNNPPAVFYDPPGKTNTTGHWMALCGYDDNINPAASDPDHRGGFLAVNCWGDHWNGQMHGYVWFSYAWVKEYVSSAFAMEGDGPNGPAITACSTNSAAVGESVTLTGTGFGALRRQACVTFNGLPATVVSFANESIAVTVPPGATSGPVIVFDWEGTPSNATNFTIRPKLRAGSASLGAKLEKR